MSDGVQWMPLRARTLCVWSDLHNEFPLYLYSFANNLFLRVHRAIAVA
jgi:hypothetical protein